MSVPSDEFIENYKRAIYWRGMIVQRYGAVEFGITHLLATASLHPSFQVLGKVPFTLTKKLARLRRLIRLPSFTEKSLDDIENYLSVFEMHEDIRHFMVHGIMTPKDDAHILFRLYQHKSGKLAQGEIIFTADKMEEVATDMERLSGDFMEFLLQMCKSLTDDIKR